MSGAEHQTEARTTRSGFRASEQLASFIGRERELASLINLLAGGAAGVRLVTLTGPPGTGKTRLALRVTDELATLGEQAWFVPLASIRDPTLVAQAIAQALGVREVSDEPVVEGVFAFLERKSGLLMLDSFEHILAGAPLVTRLLEHCRQVKVLVTSRAPLRVYGEQEFLMPPLPLPNGPATLPLEDLLRSDAMKLLSLERRRSSLSSS